MWLFKLVCESGKVTGSESYSHLTDDVAVLADEGFLEFVLLRLCIRFIGSRPSNSCTDINPLSHCQYLFKNPKELSIPLSRNRQV